MSRIVDPIFADMRVEDGGLTLRLAIIIAAVPLGLAGLAISMWESGRRRPLLISVAVLVADIQQ